MLLLWTSAGSSTYGGTAWVALGKLFSRVTMLVHMRPLLRMVTMQWDEQVWLGTEGGVGRGKWGGERLTTGFWRQPRSVSAAAGGSWRLRQGGGGGSP